MTSYSMVATAVLLATPWISHNPKAWPTQPEVQADTGTRSQAQSTGTNNKDLPSANTVAASPSSGQATFFILAEFTQSLNAKKLKPGDQVRAQVTQDVLSHGRIIIPMESKLIGHITEVKSHRTDDPGSRLGIVFDRVLLKRHMEVGVHGVLQALSAPAVRRSKADEPDPMLSPNLVGITRPTGRTNSIGGDMGSAADTALNPAGSPPWLLNGTSAGNAAAGIPSQASQPRAVTGEQKPMSVGMPLGVFGLKGLSLTPEATASTPGPVILSRMDDVKLESGTQVLLKVTDVTVP
jgi:hypothetical protein